MANLGVVEAPKTVMMGNSSTQRRRIEQEEAEIAELERLHRGEVQPDAASTEVPATEVADDEATETLSKEEQTYKKRYGDLRRHMNELTDKLKNMESRLENAQKEGGLTAPKSEADIAAWMKQYPDVAAMVEAIADRKAQERFATAETRLQRIDAMEAEADRKRREAEIRAVHSDFDSLRSSDDFHGWAEEQPKWVQDALYENADDPKSVIKVIDLYKYENNLDTRGKAATAKNAATAVLTKRTKTDVDATGGSNKIYESAVSKMSDREYEKRQDEIMEAIRNGNFVYDISGAAR